MASRSRATAMPGRFAVRPGLIALALRNRTRSACDIRRFWYPAIASRGNGQNMAGYALPWRGDPGSWADRKLSPDGLAERARCPARHPHDLLRDLPPDPGFRPEGAAPGLARHCRPALHRHR